MDGRTQSIKARNNMGSARQKKKRSTQTKLDEPGDTYTIRGLQNREWKERDLILKIKSVAYSSPGSLSVN